MQTLPFFQQPIGMRRDPTLQGELGPVYRDAAGNIITIEPKQLPKMAPVKPQEDRPGPMRRLGEAMLPMGNWSALGRALWEGLSAPRRAMQGEPVTYGETFGTALDAMGGGAFASAPEGSLRMGAALNNKTMYHGTPDVRSVRDAGGFAPRTSNVRRVKNYDEWRRIQDAMQTVERGSDEHMRLLDQANELSEYAEIPTPVFLTPDQATAKSYANAQRAWDYQSAEPGVLSAASNPRRILDVNAGGASFRGISKDAVRSGLKSAGVPEDQIEAQLQRYIFGRSDDSISTDDLAAIAHDFGFDAIDVGNVVDTYTGKGRKTTVRMMMRPDQITLK